jgi:hypothetical protein
MRRHEAWLAARANVPMGVSWLLLADVDGVVTAGEGQPVELDVLARLMAANAAAVEDPTVPVVALCTGRQAPYVEMLAQAIGTFLPCIFEQGAGLFDPVAFEFAFHPAVGDAYAARLASLRSALDEPLLRAGRAFVQPGKEATMSLYPLAGATIAEIGEAAAGVIARTGLDFTVTLNATCVELRPPGVDKGLGARWLAERVGVPQSAMAGAGDSDPDLAFLELIGRPTAPANGSPAVRAAAHFVSTAPFGRGLLEILDWVTEQNRRVLGDASRARSA